MTKGVAGCSLGQTGAEHSFAHGSLDRGLVEVVPATLVGFGVMVDTCRGEKPLPGELSVSAGQLPVELVGKCDVAGSSGYILPVLAFDLVTMAKESSGGRGR